MNWKIIAGILVLVFAILLMAHVIVSVKMHIPADGAGTLYQYQPPYHNAGLVKVIQMILAAVVFLTGCFLLALGKRDNR
ncbi:MAG: hypothetical protein IJM18_03345 [Clostridia bacterium]|nr:hypothetical protein [Clostridia bacterium]